MSIKDSDLDEIVDKEIKKIINKFNDLNENSKRI